MDTSIDDLGEFRVENREPIAPILNMPYEALLNDPALNRLSFPNKETCIYNREDIEQVEIIANNRNTVEKCFYRPYGKFIAVKHVPIPLSQYPDPKKEIQMERLMHEIKVHSRLKHSDYIVQLFGFCIHERHVLICMELMNMSLKDFYTDIHRRYGCFQEDLLGYIMVRVVNALNELHTHKMMHRDIKPTNILVNLSGEIKLCDFGEARKLEEDLATTSVGTIAYWPPERVMPNDGYDSRADIWSLGITLAEVMTKRLPYEDKNGKECAKLNTLIDCIQAANAEDIITRCFVYNPKSCAPRVHKFLNLCLSKYEERPYCDALMKTSFYLRYYSESKDLIFDPYLEEKPKLSSDLHNRKDPRLNENFTQVNIGDCKIKVPASYKVESIIGGGSYGIVIKAIDNITGKHVAIKRLRHPFNQQGTAKRAYREFELLQIVNHKNVIQLLNAYTPQDKLSEFEEVYFVMEYMDYPVRALIHERKTQFQGLNGGRQMSFLIYQLLCGVNHLHQAGIAHRDLTPDNVMIDTRFQLKIVGFGSASQLNSYNDRSAHVTMRFYRAPEVVLRVDYDHKIDVWSIGCIFAELLTGNILCRSILCPAEDQYDQWTKIVEVVGTPDENFISRLDEQLQSYVRSMPKNEAIPWETLFPDQHFPTHDRPFCSAENGRYLLSRMLVIDPERRISVEEALKQSYISWKNHVGELSSPPRGEYDRNVELKTFSKDEWKRLIFERIKDYEKINMKQTQK